MSGATPAYLSCGFVLEEGAEMSVVGRMANDIGAAARDAGVRVVTGDTKVVDSGHGDEVYVNTAGIGLVPDGIDIRPDRAEHGDVVIVSGPIGVHNVAIMSVREGIEFGSQILSDTAALTPLVQAMLAVTPDVHVLRIRRAAVSRRRSPRSPAHRASACGWSRVDSRAAKTWPTRARCSVLIRYTSPMRAS